MFTLSASGESNKTRLHVYPTLFVLYSKLFYFITCTISVLGQLAKKWNGEAVCCSE